MTTNYTNPQARTPYAQLARITAFTAITIATQQHAYTDQVTWQNPASGLWDTLSPATTNWSPNALGTNTTPDPTQDATFNLDSTGYTVTLNTNPTNNRLLVLNDTVTLDLATHNYTLTNINTSPDPATTLAAQETDTATLNINATTGTLNTVNLDAALSGTATLNLNAGTLNTLNTNLAVNTTANATANIHSATLNADNAINIATAGTATLTLHPNATINAATSTLARDPGSNATAHVNDAQWINTGPLIIADQGTATLNINTNAFVSNTIARIANVDTANATVNITNATWNNTGSLRIADQGTATLNINTNAFVSNTQGEIANDTGSTGHVHIDNATWASSTSLIIANAGTATLNATNNAHVQSTTGRIADQPDSNGTATFNNARWQIGGSLRVGAEGTGTLNIQHDALVTNTSARVGSRSDAHGTVNVDNATWTNTSTLRLADDGTGILNITNNATVNTDAASIAHDSGSSGTANINNATWNNTDDLSIGNEGHGEITLENNATLNTRSAFLANDPGSSASATVNHGTWTNTQNLAIGGGTAPGGIAILTLNTDAHVQATATTVWPNGTLQINDGTLQTNTFVNHKRTVIDAGTVNIDGINFALQNSASIPDSTLLHIGPTAQVNVPNGNVLNLTDAVLQLNGQLTTKGISNAGNFIATDATLNLTHDPFNNNTGTLTAINSTLNLTGDGSPPPSGAPATDGLVNRATLNLVDTTINGDLHSPAGSTINATRTATFNGHVSGAANLNGPATFIFNHSYTPGDSTAAVTATGNVTFGPDHTLTIEVTPPAADPPTPGLNFDQLNITQDFIPNGTLHIDPQPNPDSFAAPYGTTYPIITFATRNAAQSDSSMFHTITGTLINNTLALAPLLDLHANTFKLRATIPGDLNFDNKVSVADLSALALNFNTTVPGTGLFNELTGQNSWQLGDFNTDGAITVADLSLLALNFGFDATDPSTPATGLSLAEAAALVGIVPSTIPEPTTATLWIFAATATLTRRNKQKPTA